MSLLVAASGTGSLSAAARALGVPLTTVSRAISDLEAHLRTRLLNRSSRRLSLTDAGEAYLAACKRILEEVQEAERAATGEYHSPRGELTVAAPVAFGRLRVVPAIAAFLALFPEIDIRLVLSDQVADLLEDRIDLAVRIGDLPDSGLSAVRVGVVRTVVCGSPGYFDTHGVPSHPEDLSGHACVTCVSLMAPDVWKFSGESSVLAVPVRSRLAVNTAEAAVDAAVTGVGITRVLSYQAADAMAAGLLRVVLEPFEPRPRPVHLVFHGGRRVPSKTRAFLDFAVAGLRAALADPDPAKQDGAA